MAVPYLYAAMAALQVINGLDQADSIGRTAKINQRIADMNAGYADLDAWEAEKMGYTEAARYQNVIDTTVADQRATMAASNIDITKGSAKELINETKLTGFLNLLDIKRGAQAKAKGLKIEASNIRIGGAMNQIEARMNADAARSSGMLRALNTGVTGYENNRSLNVKDPQYARGRAIDSGVINDDVLKWGDY